MSGLYGRPTAAELVAVVADFLDNDVRRGRDGRPPSGQVNFHARVAANVLRIVERELLDGPAADVSGALEGLGFSDEAELAAAIRAGIRRRPPRRRAGGPAHGGAPPARRRPPRLCRLLAISSCIQER